MRLELNLSRPLRPKSLDPLLLLEEPSYDELMKGMIPQYVSATWLTLAWLGLLWLAAWCWLREPFAAERIQRVSDPKKQSTFTVSWGGK